MKNDFVIVIFLLLLVIYSPFFCDDDSTFHGEMRRNETRLDEHWRKGKKEYTTRSLGNKEK